MQERRNSIANALDLRLFCIKASKWCSSKEPQSLHDISGIHIVDTYANQKLLFRNKHRDLNKPSGLSRMQIIAIKT